MGENVKYYNVEDFNIWRRKQGRNLKSPPRANFLAAANHVKNLLDGKSINWAAFGGLAILCLGSHREMPDIHIVYDAQDFPKIQKRLELDRRVRLPRGMNSLFPAKVLVSTGPQYKDKCTENADIEVDLIPPGFYGAPPNETLRKNQVLLRLNLDGKISNFKGLSILYLVKTALQFCKSQDLAWDPKRDIKFLCLSNHRRTSANALSPCWVRNLPRHRDPLHPHREHFPGPQPK
ncbi:hypothetical protein CC78DRAFT_354342 [Lojkania enalia]|uniref:Uncharacterized protein n=1 Tax=Lojkania enalia TaxID=147567 RepID=A0A9P4KHN8_9PLEO|nr:hypothetical protein CC78DRAFT_354342 [Didymosphaeria enalia]